MSRTGSVARAKRARRKYILEEKQIALIVSVVSNTQQSMVRVAGECDVATTTFKEYLKTHRFHPNKLMKMTDRRMQFCELISKYFTEKLNCIKWRIFSCFQSFF